MSQHDYTIKELEDIVFNHSRCYKDSEAFQSCLEYVKKNKLSYVQKYALQRNNRLRWY